MGSALILGVLHFSGAFEVREVAIKFVADAQGWLGKFECASQWQFSISDRGNSPYIKRTCGFSSGVLFVALNFV